MYNDNLLITAQNAVITLQTTLKTVCIVKQRELYNALSVALDAANCEVARLKRIEARREQRDSVRRTVELIKNDVGFSCYGKPLANFRFLFSSAKSVSFKRLSGTRHFECVVDGVDFVVSCNCYGLLSII